MFFYILKHVDRNRTHLQNGVLLGFVDFSCEAAVSDGILDDRFVGLRTRLLK